MQTYIREEHDERTEKEDGCKKERNQSGGKQTIPPTHN
jgi:hypothetical protein